MSYILDALRKADAQRARDPAHGIHAQASVAPLGASSGRRLPFRWLGAGVAALAVITAAWVLLRRGEEATVPPVAAVAPAPTMSAPHAPPPASAVLPAPAPGIVVPPEPRPVLRPHEPARQAGAAMPAAGPAAPMEVAPGSAPSPVAVASTLPAAAPRPVDERVYGMGELPDDVRQAMPKFSISGGVFSENVAQRMLIVNGQVFNEGSEIVPGVVLDQVRPRNAVLKFRGLRISQPY